MNGSYPTSELTFSESLQLVRKECGFQAEAVWREMMMNAAQSFRFMLDPFRKRVELSKARFSAILQQLEKLGLVFMNKERGEGGQWAGCFWRRVMVADDKNQGSFDHRRSFSPAPVKTHEIITNNKNPEYTNNKNNKPPIVPQEVQRIEPPKKRNQRKPRPKREPTAVELARKAIIDECFEEICEAYPQAQGRLPNVAKDRAAWEKLCVGKLPETEIPQLAVKIISAIHHHRKYDHNFAGETKYVPSLAKFISEGKYDIPERNLQRAHRSAVQPTEAPTRHTRDISLEEHVLDRSWAEQGVSTHRGFQADAFLT